MTIARSGLLTQYRGLFSAITVAVLAMLGQGCAESEEDSAEFRDEPDSLAVAKEALTTMGTWTDSSGTITVTFYKCDWSAASQTPSATCSVPYSDVIVGGGGDIDGTGSPGALLTGSYPQADLQTWKVTSKSHINAYSHRIRAYAIGLRLSGVSGYNLRTQMSKWDTRSCMGGQPPKSRPTVTDYGTAGDSIVIGGGAYTEYNGVGQMLTDSYPVNHGWFAGSKDHITVDLGWVHALTLSIPRCPTGYTGGCLKTMIKTNNGMANLVGYTGDGAQQNLSGYLLIGIGGSTSWTGYGRMLAHLFPTTSIGGGVGGVQVISKDHLVADATGKTQAVALFLAKE